VQLAVSNLLEIDMEIDIEADLETDVEIDLDLLRGVTRMDVLAPLIYPAA
jgi:hypothetical protein